MDSRLPAQIIESTPDAVIVAGVDGVIRLWNPGAEALFGHAAEEALGRTLDLIIPEKQRARHWEAYDRAMATGQTRYGRELLSVPANRKDGTRISVEFTVALLKNGEGAVEGVAAIMRDGTARWQRDRARDQEIAELREKLAAAGQPAP